MRPVYLMGRFSMKRAMRALMVIKVKEVLQTAFQFRDGFIAPQVNVFVFNGTPQAFNEDIIQSTSSSVHTDQYLPLQQLRCKFPAGKLAALIRVEDAWLTLLKCRL